MSSDLCLTYMNPPWPHTFTKASKSLVSSQPGAPFGFHIEDNNALSFSHLHIGQKVWICVGAAHAALAEAEFRGAIDEARVAASSAMECTQWVRHEGLFCAGAALSRRGVPVAYVDQRAGEVVVTLPGTYHAGFSTMYTRADAVNYAPPGYDFGNKDMVECSGCPVSPFKNKFFAELAPGEAQIDLEDYVDSSGEEEDDMEMGGDQGVDDEDSEDVEEDGQPATPPQKSTRSAGMKRKPRKTSQAVNVAKGSNSAGKRQEAPLAETLEQDVNTAPAKKARPSPPEIDVQDLADKVSALKGLHQLRLLVGGWREYAKAGGKLEFPRAGDTKRLAGLVMQSAHQDKLMVFVHRLALAKLPQTVDGTKIAGQQRVGSNVVARVLEEAGWAVTPANRRRLGDFLETGRKWNRLCETAELPGLLCLIPVNRGSDKNYLGLIQSDQHYKKFVGLVGGAVGTKTYPGLCLAAHTFLQAVVDNKDVPRFKWELEETDDPGCFDETDLVNLLSMSQPMEDSGV